MQAIHMADDIDDELPTIPEPSLPKLHGITDRESGLARATASRKAMTAQVADHLPNGFGFTVGTMSLLSLLTRAQAFHDGVIGALEADNPFATMTLLRSYAENAALLVWLDEKPNELDRLLPDAGPDDRFNIGRLVAFAVRRMGGFKGIYEQLSGFAHPSSASALSGWHNEGGRRVRWGTHPEFKNDDDFMMACVWVVELAEANTGLWLSVWDKYFGPSPTYRVRDLKSKDVP
jgi:hypothetical protein